MNYLSTETEAEHEERAGAEETSEEVRWCTRCRRAETEACASHDKAVKTEQRTLVCSCGFKTCPLIHRYGLSVPTFEGEIRPIPSQFSRDRRALDIKAEGRL